MDRGYLELVYLVTALVPSDTACLASSPGSIRRTAVWISLEVMVDLGEGRVRKQERTGNNSPLVVMGELAGLGGDPSKEVVHERVHDRHGLGGDTSVGVHLLQHLKKNKLPRFTD